MINGLSEIDIFKVVRPVIDGCELDSHDFPIIQAPTLDSIDWENIYPINYQNLSPKNDNSNAVALMFRYDKELLALWNNPLKRVPLFQGCMAVCTPDFSVYPSMNSNEIRHNRYMARWLGCTWQNYGCTVIPTIGWATPCTYDLCFAGVEEGCPVAISTIGCRAHQDVFWEGFEEMKRRIKPSVILVYGDMINGMAGKFIHFRYEDAFSKSGIQLRMNNVSQVFIIKEAV